MDFIKNHKKLVIVVVVVLILIFFISQGMAIKKDKDKEAEKEQILEELFSSENNPDEGEDSLLMQLQPELEATYGKVPDGFIWETDGTVLSLGDKSMSAEEVVYAYFRGLSSLDMSTATRYSRNSVVVDTYSSYFDESNKNTDYLDQFLRSMYRYCLLSIQLQEIESVSVFAENKQVFSVKAEMLDLTNKDFWEDDSLEIYKSLYLYDSDESDSTKSDMYLYNYILDYYRSNSAKLRTVNFDITVQRYSDLDSGWLVSIDTDVNDACQYRDGTLVVSYIRDMYSNVGRDIILDSMRGEE